MRAWSTAARAAWASATVWARAEPREAALRRSASRVARASATPALAWLAAARAVWARCGETQPWVAREP
jgi:hypothetical protein